MRFSTTETFSGSVTASRRGSRGLLGSAERNGSLLLVQGEGRRNRLNGSVEIKQNAGGHEQEAILPDILPQYVRGNESSFCLCFQRGAVLRTVIVSRRRLPSHATSCAAVVPRV